ncbi:unnamed protein product [Spirodela intermedia]|uniref:Uncharacterized protein n=2 Tax=Spirodela intermedia TaxID=51605 RepID=A0A7I8LCG6_SPIIN|nr:unnamed protein product [Spirodela intermedia]CAA6670631.1 unnamed protein product [Spirodela intermedia]CAA7407713.1 unnamed protein product [Spirodela intermedia]
MKEDLTCGQRPSQRSLRTRSVIDDSFFRYENIMAIHEDASRNKE